MFGILKKTSVTTKRTLQAASRPVVELLENRKLLSGIASISDATVTESGLAVFTVSLDAPATDLTTVKFATQAKTAKFNKDIIKQNGVVSFNIGESSQTISIATVDDAIDEADKTFNVKLSGPSKGTKIGDSLGVGTLLDNDASPIASINSVSQLEGKSGSKPMNFALNLAGLSEQKVTVVYTTADGSTTAGSDYVGVAKSVTIKPGKSTAKIAVKIKGDKLPEGDETFSLNLTGATNATLGTSSGVGTIIDDDGGTTVGPTLSISDVSVNEGTGSDPTATLTVTLSAASLTPVTVNYATSAGTATATTDFTAASGTLTFDAGQTTKQIAVTVLGDGTTESSEAFTVALSGASGATISKSSGTVTVNDDDSSVVLPTLSIANVTQAEGTGIDPSATLTVTLSAAATSAVTVNYVATSGTAVAGLDFSAANGTLTFAPGQTSKQIPVTITADNIAEADETFTVVLSNPSGATLADSGATVTITDDDSSVTPSLPNLSIGNVTVTEGTGADVPAVFPVTLSAASLETITVDFTSASGTAISGTDFTAALGTVTFAPGETTKNVTIQVTGDALAEGTENFVVNLSNISVNANLVSAQGVATIEDNEGIDFPDSTFIFTSQGQPQSDIHASFQVQNNSGALVSGAVVQFFLAPQGADLNTVTPLTTVTLADIASGQSVSQSNVAVDGTGVANSPGFWQYTARLVLNGIVYDEERGPLFNV